MTITNSLSTSVGRPSALAAPFRVTISGPSSPASWSEPKPSKPPLRAGIVPRPTCDEYRCTTDDGSAGPGPCTRAWWHERTSPGERIMRPGSGRRFHFG
eukprot:3545244-Prymnesium_polylepis.3